MLDSRQTQDLHILRLVEDGERERAVAALMKLYGDLVYRAVLRTLRNRAEAEEVCQEVFLSLHRGLDGFRGDSSLKTFVLGVTFNKVASRRRALARMLNRHEKFEEYTRIGASPKSGCPEEALARRDAIEVCLGCLSTTDRYIVLLRHQEGLSTAEVAEIAKIGPVAVRKRLSRAVHKLRSCLRKKLGEGFEDAGL